MIRLPAFRGRIKFSRNDRVVRPDYGDVRERLTGEKVALTVRRSQRTPARRPVSKRTDGGARRMPGTVLVRSLIIRSKMSGRARQHLNDFNSRPFWTS